jgi:hypothetical protein
MLLSNAIIVENIVIDEIAAERGLDATLHSALLLRLATWRMRAVDVLLNRQTQRALEISMQEYIMGYKKHKSRIDRWWHRDDRAGQDESWLEVQTGVLLAKQEPDPDPAPLQSTAATVGIHMGHASGVHARLPASYGAVAGCTVGQSGGCLGGRCLCSTRTPTH